MNGTPHARTGRLTLLVPGLLGPDLPAGAPPGAGAAMTEGLDLPGLERVLARADRVGEVPGPLPDLFALAGVETPSGADLPCAAVSLLGEGRDPGDGCWLRADPVHLRADLTDLVLAPPAILDLDAAEAARLAADLDAHFAADGLRFEVAAPGRWYLRLDAAPALETVPPAQAAGRPISDLLPRGAQGALWHARINEAQMLLHASPVNRERAARGRPPVNSIWPWGAGRLPPAPAGAGVDAIVGGGVVGRGLARLAGAAWEDDAGGFAALEPGGRVLVSCDALGAAAALSDVEAWRAALAALEAAWIVPALDALGRGRLDVLELRAAPLGARRLTRGGARRFWRRARRLGTLIDARAPAPVTAQGPPA